MITYNELEKLIFQLKDRDNRCLPSILFNIKEELNKIFPGRKCNKVIFNDNIDGLFFGMYLKPVYYGPNEIQNLYIIGDLDKNIKEYCIELDSKLFDFVLGLTTPQITALILHDISNLTNTIKSILDIRAYINIYIYENGINLSLIDNKPKFFTELFVYGITETTRNLTSIFKTDVEELIANEFMRFIGYNRQLEDAYKVLSNKTETPPSDDTYKFKPIHDALMIYGNIENNKKLMKFYIQGIIPSTGSITEKELINKVQEQFNYMKTSTIEHIEYLDIIKEAKFIKKIQLGGLRAIEDDLYEYNIRIKNVDDELEAIDILRSINYRINLIDDYIEYNKISESEINRWEDIKYKFINLREQLSKTSVYKKKAYGLFVQYPVSS